MGNSKLVKDFLALGKVITRKRRWRLVGRPFFPSPFYIFSYIFSYKKRYN